MVTQSLVKLLEKFGQGRGIVDICAIKGFLLVAVFIVTNHVILGHSMAARGLRPIPVRVVHSGIVVSKLPKPSMCFLVGWVRAGLKNPTVLAWCKGITGGMLYSAQTNADCNLRYMCLDCPKLN